MGMFTNVRRIRQLMAKDVQAHIGDIAVLKMDAARMRPLPEHEAAITAIASYRPRVDLAQLATLPSGTFGRAYAEFMSHNGLSPLVLTDEIGPELRAANAFGIRLASTHDLVHVLSGFDTSWPGEMGVYAVQFAQRWSRLSWWLGAATWLVYPLLTGFRIGALRAAWARGVAIGEAAPFLLGERLEDRFEESLAEVRRSYGIAELV
jgi:ubiquinone biosynthesis protein COQ4